jgi:hypothetical protein
MSPAGVAVTVAVVVAILGPIAMVILFSLFARLGGWATLAERYPGRPRPARVACRFGCGTFRGWIGYNGGLVVGSDGDGLDLRAMPVILSFTHAPIFIPWGEIARIDKQSRWFGDCYGLVTRRAPEVDLALRPGTFAAVRAAARSAGVAGDY